MSSNSASEPQKLPWSLLRAGGRHGLSDTEKRDPIGLAVAALNRLASSDLLDSLGLRKASERGVYRVTSAGFRTAGNVGRTFARAGKATRGNRVPAAKNTGLFDLTPGEDEQMLADVVGEFAAEVVRPAASAANEECAAPAELLKSTLEIGLPILGVPEELGGITTERSAVAG
ncbi:MAG: acyl-CoA dehydrogenase family protein, partial [Marmoricola sp.]